MPQIGAPLPLFLSQDRTPNPLRHEQSAPAVGGAFPNASNTGVPAGQSLTVVPSGATSGAGWSWNGTQVVATGNGVTISNLDVTSSIDASTRTGVLIKNCRVRGIGEASFLVALGGGSTVQDSELGGGADDVTYTITSNQSPIGVYSGGSTARSGTILRCNIHHTQDAIRGDGGTYTKDTYIHHLNNGYGVADPFQFHTDGCQQTQGAGLMEFDHNSIETGNNDCIFIEIGTSAYLITNNYFTGRTGPGGSASFAIGGKTSEVAHGTITIAGNTFDTANCGQPCGNWPAGQVVVDGGGNVNLTGAPVGVT